MSTFSIFLILIIIVCLLLMLVVMVQNPKGGGLSSSFGGGGGGSQIVGGVKKTGDFLDKSTWTLAITLVVLILASNVALKGNFGTADSKLLNDDGIEETLPDEVPEALPEDILPTDSATPQDSV